MNYYIKIGSMYIFSIRVSKTATKTEFIDDIELQNKKDYCFKICEEEKEFFRDKIAEILNLKSGNPNDIITFEEVEEDE